MRTWTSKEYKDRMLSDVTYTPQHLINMILETCNLKNDAALARRLKYSRTTIDFLRHRQRLLSDAVILAMHEGLDIEVADLRKWSGTKSKFAE